MNIIERVKDILMRPGPAWDAIAGEPATTVQLYRDYVAPLAAIGPAASIIGLSLIGMQQPLAGFYRVPILTAVTEGVSAYALTLVGVYVIALLVDALARDFGGERNPIQALKLTAYSATPGWVAGVVHLVPALGGVALLAALYGAYLFYLGLPRLMKVPQERAILFTVIVLVAGLVVVMILGAALRLFMSAANGMSGWPAA